MVRRVHIFPRSLLGQTLLGVALALLVAQGFSGFLLWQTGERNRESIAINRLALQYSLSRAGGSRDGVISDGLEGGAPEFGLRRARRNLVEAPILPPIIRENADAGLADDLRSAMAREGTVPNRLVVAAFIRSDAPRLRELGQRVGGQNGAAGPPPWITERHGGGHPDDRVLIAAVRYSEGGSWWLRRGPIRGPDRAVVGGILLQTLVIYTVLVGLLALLLRRVTRPLSELTERIRAFGHTQEVSSQLEPRGPEDVRELIQATNDMEARIAALIDEKDIMLGAIGHDLKTPLAALRVRIESVEDPAQREKMAGTISEIRESLDDILALARVGKGDEPPERTDLAALMQSVVDEFEDMGEPVTADETDRVTALVYPNWLKRALRNLVANAVRYGGNANVSLLQEGGNAVLRVCDNGPGIPDSNIAAMTEPFTRGENSRNRATGGAGLGLAIARAVAEQLGGRLRLVNRAEGGLCADLVFPARQ